MGQSRSADGIAFFAKPCVADRLDGPPFGRVMPQGFDGSVTPPIPKINLVTRPSNALQSAFPGEKIAVQGAMAMRILLVEDDTEIAGHVSHALTAAGHDVESTIDGRMGLSRALSGEYAALILDRMLPGLDGLSMTKQLRAQGNETPILLITTMTGID